MSAVDGAGMHPSAQPVRGGQGLPALWAATAVSGLAQSLAGSAGALLAAHVSGSDALAGLPQAALVAGSAAAALGLSAIAVRRSRRASLATGTSTALLGCTVVVTAAATSSLFGVLVGSLLLGAGNTAVMLARYAAADLTGTVDDGSRAQAMATVLLATTLGAVLGPNLLAPANNLGSALGLPPLGGPYLLAGAAFAAATALLTGLPTSGRPSSTAFTPAAPPSRLGRDGALGLVVLGTANVVMVAVMTMAPLQLHHLGHGLATIGVVISLHIAAMFAPSPLSERLARRVGTHRAATIAGCLLIAASGLAAAGAESPRVLGIAMVVRGAAWNLALVSGSVLLTTGVPAAARPRREGWGEVSMGLAAAGGGAAAGPLVTEGGYVTLAVAGAVTAALLLPTALLRSARQATRSITR